MRFRTDGDRIGDGLSLFSHEGGEKENRFHVQKASDIVHLVIGDGNEVCCDEKTCREGELQLRVKKEGNLLKTANVV